MKQSKLSPERSAELRASLSLGESPVVLYCGNLLRLKGVDVLLRAFAEVAKEVPNARLLIVGSGEGAKAFRVLADELEIAHAVVWQGYVEPGDVAQYYGIADVFVLPSRSEVWGLVVNEALAASVPAIVSDAAGASEDLVQDGQNGRVFPSEDEHALAKALSEILTDDAQRARMAEAARVSIAPFTIDAMAGAFELAVDAAIAHRAEKTKQRTQ